jgi:PAS domain S-box-containing protein
MGVEMPFRQHASIQRKLTFVILSTSLLGLSVACLAFEIYERASYRGALTSDLSALASTLGANTTASLAFNDHQSAVDILKGLRAEPHVLAACLYDKRGQLFVEYQRGPGGPDCNRPVLRQDGARFETGSVTVFRNVVLDGDVAGGIAIISDLDGLHAKIRQYTVIAAVVMLLSTLTTFLVSSRLIRLITQPILKLADIAGRVSEHQDYSLRAEAGTNDEVGTLISSFNDMLEGIQERDWALQMVNDQLETRVEERTWALQQEVADRTAAEAKLQSSLKELGDLKFALDQHCIVARTVPNGAITFVNEKFCSVSKYSREELIGQTHRLINSQYHPGEFMAELWRTIESGQVWKGELRNRAKTGEIYWVDTTIVPFCDSRGKPLQFIAIRSDITALKTIENDLRAAKEAAEAASRAKSEFLANMSHEIRTPLNGVMGMTELALETHLTAEQREYLETVKTSADSLLTVINDILDFSKIEAGKIDLEDVNFNLRESLESTLKTVALRADQKGLELLCDVAPDVPEIVRGDSTRLR